MSPTADPLLFPAHACLERQLWEHETYGCSLEGIWRACGSPPGMDPESWLRNVADMIGEVFRYVRALDPECRLLDDRPRATVWPWPADLRPRGDWRAGDTLA